MSGVGTRLWEEKALPAPDRSECLRYLRAPQADERLEALLDSCLDELAGQLSPRLCYRVCSASDAEVAFLRESGSRALAERLAGCSHVLVLAATLGVGIDRLIARYTSLSPARALCLQAIGCERIEAVCDSFCEEWRLRGFVLRARFSPGYGDLALELQRDIFAYLDCPTRIGLYLRDSLLMTPTKSVTAIVGIEGEGMEERFEFS